MNHRYILVLVVLTVIFSTNQVYSVEIVPTSGIDYGPVLCKGKVIDDYRIQIVTYPFTPAAGKPVEIVITAEYLDSRPAADVELGLQVYKGVVHRATFGPVSSSNGIFRFLYEPTDHGELTLAIIIMRGVNVTVTYLSLPVRAPDEAGLLGVLNMLSLPLLSISLFLVIFVILRRYGVI
ncbi:MAG: hypothetical protein NZ920_05850 [Aigarchaeota archaeon]|nr:hypothetical protein [Aigarchaeota archaeon]MDW8092630.1 hypothetical protein [Nitrososphaerota archaeon]